MFDCHVFYSLHNRNPMYSALRAAGATSSGASRQLPLDGKPRINSVFSCVCIALHYLMQQLRKCFGFAAEIEYRIVEKGHKALLVEALSEIARVIFERVDKCAV